MDVDEALLQVEINPTSEENSVWSQIKQLVVETGSS